MNKQGPFGLWMGMGLRELGTEAIEMAPRRLYGGPCMQISPFVKENVEYGGKVYEGTQFLVQ